MFQQHLKTIVDNVEGGLAGLLMGFDGIPVDDYTRSDLDEPIDIKTIGMEFSFVMTQMRKAAEILEVGGMQEVAIKADQLTLVFRILTHDYFVAVALAPSGNFGKARFLLRIQVPKLLEALA
jgi:predicted regulator of Ras-like GTPase activity (Roadblock/LC7/MglB family)